MINIYSLSDGNALFPSGDGKGASIFFAIQGEHKRLQICGYKRYDLRRSIHFE
jgi:hypothetical protein